MKATTKSDMAVQVAMEMLSQVVLASKRGLTDDVLKYSEAARNVAEAASTLQYLENSSRDALPEPSGGV